MYLDFEVVIFLPSVTSSRQSTNNV